MSGTVIDALDYKPRRQRAMRLLRVPIRFLIPVALLLLYGLHRIAVREGPLKPVRLDWDEDEPEGWDNVRSILHNAQNGGSSERDANRPRAAGRDEQRAMTYSPGTGKSDATQAGEGYQQYDDEDLDEESDYHELSSLTSRSREYKRIFFNNVGTTDPSLIPHPTRHDLWVVVARKPESNERVTCNAGFLEDTLLCGDEPRTVSIPAAVSTDCGSSSTDLQLRVGHGPDAPVTAYARHSGRSCTGLWIQDARMMFEAYRVESALVKSWRNPAKLDRQQGWAEYESDFFLFWDNESRPHVHYDLWPTRAFASVSDEGVVGTDISSSSWNQDQMCMAKYMPDVIASSDQEWIEQGTNSLAITTCEREDPSCVSTDANTFILHIFNHVTFYDEHTVHEPYVILFKQAWPFGLHAISRRPLWIRGRGMLSKDSKSRRYAGRESEIPANHTENFRVTSLSWQSHYHRYHGHADDTLILAFSIEDSNAGLIDIRASDLLEDVETC